MATLHGLLATNARRTPNKTALVFGDRSHTYAQLDAKINRYAHVLQSLGVQKGGQRRTPRCGLWTPTARTWPMASRVKSSCAATPS